MAKVQYDPNNRTHKYIWDFLAHEMTAEDFEEIQTALLSREDSLDSIEKSDVYPYPWCGDPSMIQPRHLEPFMKEKMIRYADWDCALTIMLIVAKYCDIYSK